MLLFAVTGITLNHASQIESSPVTTTKSIELPPGLLDALNQKVENDEAENLDQQSFSQETISHRIPDEVAKWIGGQIGKPIVSRPADWSDDEIYMSMPGPGSDAWLAIDRETGSVEFEQTQRGWISYFNDLHKGRNTGPAWKWVLDLLALATLVFCITGLMLLIQHARRRKMTWPMVALGFVIPALVALLMIH
ncbi:hypothetical protein Pla22_39220 [Rubripirellula amarantea]|uniref:PepSY-associated TM helix n=2 Tax=Rubripirellula amarantea TaxID=2527999 RepID=A0A5C5WLV1_9BACT|nr:hypothetical protein Pla22_39220 [Rubripirellula amarantea]